MYLLVCLAFLGTALGVPVTTNEVTRDLSALYVLPEDTFPTFYDVRLFLNPRNTDYFFGNVTIRILSNLVTDTIVLQAMEMDINDIQVYTDRDSVNNLFSNFTLAEDDTHFLTIRLSEPLQPLQPYIVHINYVAQYAANMFGVYVSTYVENGVTVPLITSQLQPTFARRAFPCYDEPAKKAIFRTTIYAPEEFDVIRSNTVIRNETLQDDVPGWVKHEFEDTLVMSTYLLAYLVSNFRYVSNENNPIYHIPFRVYSRPGTQDFADFAMDFGQKNMVELEEYTEFPYLFPKMDKAAVPDFAAGAMENWGLVIYREAALLVQDGVTTTNVKQNIGRIICHENVHQWFGNEVSPLSWTYTWLNEGFANFFENYATDFVLPEWRMMDQFVIALQNVFQSDAVLSINPMTHPVFTPSQILGTFNAVAYQKSGSVIRMMQHFLTPEVFRQGLALYIRRHSRGATGPTHLYAALQEVLNASNHSIPYTLDNVLTRWTTQGGFPVITVKRTAPSAQSIQISQQRYLTDTSLSSNDRWHIPVNWVTSQDPDFSDTSPQGWVPAVGPAVSFDIPNIASADWFIVNKQQTGYYRVNYERSNWVALANALNSSHETIHLINRAQLIDDAFNLARTGRVDYDVAFELSNYLEKEKDYIPWAAANPAFNYLDLVLGGSNEYDLFKSYLLKLSAPLYAELGFQPGDNDQHVTPYHRNIIIDINCRHGNEECINTASQLLQNFRNDPCDHSGIDQLQYAATQVANLRHKDVFIGSFCDVKTSYNDVWEYQKTERLNPDIQTTVYCSGLRGGDADNFNFLWGLYSASTDSTEQSILLNSLGCTSNEERRTFYLNEVINDNSPVRDQDKHTIIVSVINSSPENMEAALDFCNEHWPEIQPRVQGLTGTTNILNAFARRLTTEAHSEKIQQFVDRHQNVFTAGELASIAAVRENIAASLTWNRLNAAVVEAWLRENYGSNASALTASLLVLISVIVALFNH